MADNQYIEDQRLVLEIKNSKPVELLVLTESYLSFASLYSNRTLKNPHLKHIIDPKLYIKEIRSGSIITELIDFAPLLFPFIENTNSLIEFFKFLQNIFGLFKEEPTKVTDVTKNECNTLSKIIQPVANDESSQMNFSTIINGNPTYNFNINNSDAVRITEGIEKYKAILDEPENNRYNKVLMYWYQVRDEVHSKTGDKAIIEKITIRPLRVIFDTDEIKQEILDDSSNFFRYAYIVDVELQTIDSRPMVYKILKIHEKIDREDST